MPLLFFKSIAFILAIVFVYPSVFAKTDDELPKASVAITLTSTEGHASTEVRAVEQLLAKWDALDTPDFIAERKPMIDEIYDGFMASTDEQVAKEVLAADASVNVAPASTIIDTTIYSSLQHQTKLKYLLQNLKNGYLQPRAGTGSIDFHEGVYLELHTLRHPKPFDWGDVELHFDYSLLDRKDYYITPYWAHGYYEPISASPAVSLGRVNHLIQKLIPASDQNEIVFVNPVPLSSLIKIVVQKGRKAQLLKNLAREKVACPVAVGWDNLISEAL